MKKLFISQPMSGKTDEAILAERERAIAAAKEKIGEDVEVIESFFEDYPSKAVPAGPAVGLWYLGKSLQLLSTADVAYFIKGWESARGCVIEHECAIAYSIEKVIEE